MKETVIHEYTIYEKVPKNEFNHDKHYNFAEDEFGSLLKPKYGHDGDGDWYITYYENLTTGEFNEHGEIKYFYEDIGRVPFEYINEFTWEEVEGLTLKFHSVNGKKVPCFIKWNENKCYVISK